MAAVPVPRLTRAVGLWGPVVAYMAVIFYASAQPDVQLPAGLDDKPTHSLAYAVLGVLVVRALAGGFGAPVTATVALLGTALTIAYGVTDEIHQMFVPGRFADANDLVADAIGAAGGAAACWVWGIIARAWSDVEGRPPHGL